MTDNYPRFSRCEFLNCPYIQTSNQELETLRCKIHVAIEDWIDQLRATGFDTGLG